MSDLARLSDEAKRFSVYSSSISIVIPVSRYYDEFLVVKGWKDNRDEGPELSYKNVGGGWDVKNIHRYLEENDVEWGLDRLGLWDRDTLLKFGGVTEVLEEVRYLISPTEMSDMFKVFERHVPDRDALDQGRGIPPHVRVVFCTPKVFSEDPVLHEEIHDFLVIHISDIEARKQIIARDHRSSILTAHEALRSGKQPKVITVCEIEDCCVC